MSILWTLIAGFLYLEMGVIFIMLLSIIKPQVWRSLFTSRFLQALSRQSNLTLYSFIGILLLFFCDSVREFFKYSNKIRDEHHYYGSVSYHEDQMRLFRGQRNFYIAGFSLFCLFVIKRVASLISEQGQLKIQLEVLKTLAERNTEFAIKQDKTASENPSSGSKCNCKEKQNITDCGDNQGLPTKKLIANFESKIDKFKEEVASNDLIGKDLAETKEVQMKALENANLKLKALSNKEKESSKDK